jgi:hypothetical protein
LPVGGGLLAYAARHVVWWRFQPLSRLHEELTVPHVESGVLTSRTEFLRTRVFMLFSPFRDQASRCRCADQACRHFGSARVSLQ